MASKLIFNSHPDSSIDDAREFLLSKMVTPFGMRHELFEEEQLNPSFKMTWHEFAFHKENEYRYRELCKPLICHVLDFVERIERAVPWHDWKDLSWEFSYHIIWYETEEAFRATQPVWFVSIRDHDGDIVHKNWKVMIDTWEADLSIQRVNDKDKRYIFWEKPEGRLKDAIISHLRLKYLREEKNKK